MEALREDNEKDGSAALHDVLETKEVSDEWRKSCKNLSN
jgi:hypothetical protein